MKKIITTISVLTLISVVVVLTINGCSGGGSSSSTSRVVSSGTMTVLNPTVTGPIAAPDRPAPHVASGAVTRNYNFFASQFDLASRGYVEEEYFISGTASRFAVTAGQTATILDTGHPYKTRIVVRKPANAADFSGTVLVEWFNVTNNMDMEYCWYQLYDYIMRKGHVWVGVSAQRVGVNALKTWSMGTASDRYATLDVSTLKDGSVLTSDALHFDIFSQAVKAIRDPVGTNPILGLTPQTIIAMGQSQSAIMLAAYVNFVEPLAQVIDAFVLESAIESSPYGVSIRNDLIVPVWKILTETDVVSFGEANYRRPDNNKFVTWEVPGTSHNDYRALVSRVFLEHRDLNGVAVEDSLACTYPVGSKAPFYHPLSAGLDQLIGWARGGAPIVSAPPLTIIQFTPTVVVDRDGFGLAKGGIRLSQVEIPTAESSGFNSGASAACSRWGYTVPFSDYTLNNTYTTHATYVSLVTAATNSVLNSKYVLAEDAAQTISDATAAVIPPNGL